MKYYIIAGEASGDLHGSNLMIHIKKIDNSAEFRFWGGDLMQKEGGTMVKHYRETAIMGITEIIKNLGKIFSFIKECKKDILEFNPDAVVLIDYPGFNMRIAKFTKENGFKTHYYISPKVWAWNTKRAFKIKKYVDYLYTILPFETDFFKPYKVKLDYVGNPICDAIAQYTFNPNFKTEFEIKKPIIALLPGSRMGELKHLLPAMLSVIKEFPNYDFVLAGASHISDDIYSQYIGDGNIKLIKGKTYDVLANAHATLVCSGTATLEAALLNCPQVVCYKFSNLSYKIGKMVIKVKYISLVNLILDKLLVKEIIQHELTTSHIKNELLKILDGPARKEMLIGYAALRIKVGGPGASQRAAELLVKRTFN